MESGFNPAQTSASKWNSRVNRVALVWAVLATLGLVASFLTHGGNHNGGEPPEAAIPKKRNAIFMVSDGMGPASVAMARNFFQHTHGTGLDPLELDTRLIGNSRTQSSDSYVTDSAAGATAFSCGIKTYNGAIAVDEESGPVATIMEAAKLAGYHTGIVVTTRLTDATPASFASHAHDRSEEDFIAEQLLNWNGTHPLGHTVDLLLGGGRCHFLPKGAPNSCRGDERDILGDAQAKGWNYVETAAEFKELELGRNVDLPLIGLFEPFDIPFTIDQTGLHPTLVETTLTAVHALERASKDSDQGFFILVEGSRIDHAGHSNDPGAQVHEVLAFNEVFKALVHYAEKEATDPTIVLSTSDHETGGLAVARQITESYPDYLWYPEVLARSKHSTEYLSAALRNYDGKGADLLKFIREKIVGKEGLDFDDVSDKEIARIAKHKASAHDLLSQMQSTRAQVGWSTHGHSAVDVNVYGSSNYPHLLDSVRGPNENIDLGHFLRKYLDIKQPTLDHLTTKLRAQLGDKI